MPTCEELCRKGRNTPFRPHGGLPYPIGRSVVVPFLPPGCDMREALRSVATPIFASRK